MKVGKISLTLLIGLSRAGPKYVASANNLADLVTKGVSKETFHALQPYLLVCGSNKLTHLLQRMIKDQGGQSS